MRSARPVLVRMLRAPTEVAERRLRDERMAREALYGRPSVTRRHVAARRTGAER